MKRLFLLVLVVPFASACGAEMSPVQSTPAPPQLFRGAQTEVRLRCGSETLRARLRQGRIVAQVGAGEEKVLAPVDDPRAKAGPAYSDGKLTLYRVPEADSWTLVGSDAGTVACAPEPKAH